MKILLLEDDLLLNEIIEEYLVSLNYDVTSVYTGNKAEDVLYEESFDLLVFDVNVPNITGFELVENIRKNNIKTPIIFITSRNTENDVIRGFSLGCDDYLKKPFELSELGLRINNVTRLCQIESYGIVKINDLISYSYDRKVIINSNKEFNLSQRESQILEYLIKNKNKTLSIDEISINNWAYDEVPEATTIRTHIKNLRKKLTNDCILTLKGIGYRLIIN
ncbi:MAG: response regulator transcription factor [Arcobacteraceae bacterium]